MPANYGERYWNVDLREGTASFETGYGSIMDRKLRGAAGYRSFHHRRVCPHDKSHGRF
jgi:hypothetical protein